MRDKKLEFCFHSKFGLQNKLFSFKNSFIYKFSKHLNICAPQRSV